MVVLLLVVVVAVAVGVERLNRDPDRNLPAMSLNMLAADVERDLVCTPVPVPVAPAVSVAIARGVAVGEDMEVSPVV